MKVNMVLSSYPDEVSESVVDVGTTWHEKATAWTQVVEEEQLLVLWNRQKVVENEVVMDLAGKKTKKQLSTLLYNCIIS